MAQNSNFVYLVNAKENKNVTLMNALFRQNDMIYRIARTK